MTSDDLVACSLNLDVSGRYEILTKVYALPEGNKSHIGTKGVCRYCGEARPELFRKEAHTFSDFLGNKKVISLDECDRCNAIFSGYESALAEIVRPYLTIGGVKGKGNKIPQTGRTRGPSIIRRIEGQPARISLFQSGGRPEDFLAIDPVTQKVKIAMPVPTARFIPRHAYKALSKMGVAILPEDELDKYRKLRAWLCQPDDQEDFACLEVVMSYAQIANPAPLVYGVLLRRVQETDEIPYMVFILVAGALCFQIDLMSDRMEHHLPLLPLGWMKINWRTAIGDGRGGQPIAIDYRGHHAENWCSRELEERRIKKVDFDIQF